MDMIKRQDDEIRANIRNNLANNTAKDNEILAQKLRDIQQKGRKCVITMISKIQIATSRSSPSITWCTSERFYSK